MKANVLDTKGKVIEEMNLDKTIFGVTPNDAVINQYLRVFLANQRQGTSSTKTKGEVSGGGKKPWKQKGTGRARVGSSRIPVWVHGGVAHGPKPKDWGLKLPKKMRRLAILSAISSKFSSDSAKILTKLDFKTPKTKEITKMLTDLGVKGKTLIILDKKNDAVLKSASNIVGLHTTVVNSLNAYDILKAKNVLLVKDAVFKLEDKYKK